MRKHSHYFKDVGHLTEIDVYRTCDLYKVDDPSGATHHAIKKLLLPGGRGTKDRLKDLTEARDTIDRRIEMLKEDNERTKIVCGVPVTVMEPSEPGFAADTTQAVLEAKHKGATSVAITRRLYEELREQACRGIKCPKCTTGGGPCYCSDDWIAELPEA